jgi:hypothetical protein
MRTTVDIDRSVLEELKVRARAEGKTLGCLMSELLARAVGKEDDAVPRGRVRWPTKAMHAKVDLEDKEALWALMDEGHDIRP